jgi:hypothetical protein
MTIEVSSAGLHDFNSTKTHIALFAQSSDEIHTTTLNYSPSLQRRLKADADYKTRKERNDDVMSPNLTLIAFAACTEVLYFNSKSREGAKKSD